MSRKSKNQSASQPAATTPRRMPRTLRLAIAFALVFALAAVYYFNPSIRHQREMIHLGDASRAHNVAFGCLGLADTATTAQVFDSPAKFAKLPPSIQDLKPRSVSVDPKAHTVVIEMGDDTVKYGYRFEPVGTSTTLWRLLLFGGESGEIHELLQLEHESLKDPTTGAITNRLLIRKQ